MDIAAIALTLSVINAAAQIIIGLRLRHCSAACCESDCIPPPPSPRRGLSSSQNDSVNIIHSEPVDLPGRSPLAPDTRV